eukprot:jgi/Mesvir1/18341/Mv14242-RA.2
MWSDRSFRSLLRCVEAVLDHGADPTELERLMRWHRHKFSPLLAFKGKYEEDRRMVRSKNVVIDNVQKVLEEQIVTSALKLSDDYDLNEIDCVELLECAYTERDLFGEDADSVRESAAGIFFEERLAIIDSLLRLLKALVWAADPLDHGALEYVRLFLRQLIVGTANTGAYARVPTSGGAHTMGNLVGNLIDLIRKLGQPVPSGVGAVVTDAREEWVRDAAGERLSRRLLVQRERSRLCECLLYCFELLQGNALGLSAAELELLVAQVKGDGKDAATGLWGKLFRLLADAAQEWAATPAPEDINLLANANLLLFTWLTAVGPTDGAPPDVPDGSTVAPDHSPSLQRLLASGPHRDFLQSLHKLVMREDPTSPPTQPAGATSTAIVVATVPALGVAPPPATATAFTSAARFAWASYLSKCAGDTMASACREAVGAAVQGRAFWHLAHTVLRSEPLRSDEAEHNRLLFAEALHRVTAAFVRVQGVHGLRVMRDHPAQWLAERAAGATSGVLLVPTSPPDQGTLFYSLVELVAETFHLDPLLARAPHVADMLAVTEERVHGSAPALAACVALLKAIARGPDGAAQVYTRLRDTGGRMGMSWAWLFSALRTSVQKAEEIEAAHASMASVTGLARDLPFSHALAPLMSDEDAGGLIAFVSLLETVLALATPTERLQMWQDLSSEVTQWRPLELLFAMCRCPIPTTLKAACRGAIASLAFSPAMAEEVWRQLELSGTLHSAGNVESSPAGKELLQVECQDERYPATTALLGLLNRLLEVHTEYMLAQPSFIPTFKFVVEVFAGLPNRGYKDPVEQQQLALACLQHFLRVLDVFVPGMPPAMGGGLTPDRGLPAPMMSTPSPGRQLMADFLSESWFAQRLLELATLGLTHLTGKRIFSPATGQPLEACVDTSLRILIAVLARDRSFIEVERQVGSQLSLQPAHNILHRYGQGAKHSLAALLELAGYEYRPSIPLSAVRILRELCTRGNVVPTLLQSGRGASIMQNVAKALNAAVEMPAQWGGALDVGATVDLARALSSIEGEGAEPAALEQACGAHILRLLRENLPKPAPNAAHLLLGFDCGARVECSYLAPEHRFSCLRVLLALASKPAHLLQGGQARMQEQCFQLLYELSTDPVTCEPILHWMARIHFARVCQQSLEEAGAQPLPPLQEGEAMWRRPAALHTRAWVLRLVTVVLHTANLSERPQKEACVQLLQILFPRAGDSGAAQGLGAGWSSAEEPEPPPMLHPARPLVFSLLETAELGPLQAPDLLLADVRARLAAARPDAARCWDELGVSSLLLARRPLDEGGLYELSERGAARVHVAALKARLVGDGRALQAAFSLSATGVPDASLRASEGSGGSAMAVAGAEAVRCAHLLNQLFEEEEAQVAVVTAWRQLLEVVLTRRFEMLEAVMGPSLAPEELLYETLGTSLGATCHLQPGTPPRVVAEIAQLAQTAMAKLHELSLRPLAGTLGASASQGVAPVDLLRVSRLSVAKCHEILEKMLAAVTRPQTSTGYRRRLYGALLSYLNYCSGTRTQAVPASVLHALTAGASNELSRDAEQSIKQVYHDQLRLDKGNAARLLGPGRRFLEQLARDAVSASHKGGHEMLRVTAFFLAGALLGLCPGSPVGLQLLDVLEEHGVLSCVMLDLSNSEPQVVLVPSQGAVRQLFRIEAQLGFLLQVATLDGGGADASIGAPHGARMTARGSGAQRLVGDGLFTYLVKCRLLDIYVEGGGGTPALMAAGGGGATGLDAAPVPNVRERHFRVFSAVLRLVLAVQAALPQSDDVAQRVADFVAAHQPVLARVTAERATWASPWDLEELQLVAALLAGVDAKSDPTGPSASQAGLPTKLRRWMFMLMARHCRAGSGDSSKFERAARGGYLTAPDAAASGQERQLAATLRLGLLKLRVSLVSHLHALVAAGLRLRCAEEDPATASGALIVASSHDGMSVQLSAASPGPTLVQVAALLGECAAACALTLKEKGQLLLKLQDVRSDDIMDDIIATYAPRPYKSSELNTSQKHHAALLALSHAVSQKEQEQRRWLLLCEKSLHILLLHLDTTQPPGSGRPASTAATPPGAGRGPATPLGDPSLRSPYSPYPTAGGGMRSPGGGSAWLGSKVEVEELSEQLGPVANRLLAIKVGGWARRVTSQIRGRQCVQVPSRGG